LLFLFIFCFVFFHLARLHAGIHFLLLFFHRLLVLFALWPCFAYLLLFCGCLKHPTGSVVFFLRFFFLQLFTIWSFFFLFVFFFDLVFEYFTLATINDALDKKSLRKTASANDSLCMVMFYEATSHQFVAYEMSQNAKIYGETWCKMLQVWNDKFQASFESITLNYIKLRSNCEEKSFAE
jgi:hypothetical protein